MIKLDNATSAERWHELQTNRAQFRHEFTFDFSAEGEEMQAWCRQNLLGAWKAGFTHLWLDDDKDAGLVKLMHGEFSAYRRRTSEE